MQRSHLLANGAIDGDFEFLYRSQQSLAGYTRKIGFVESALSEMEKMNLLSLRSILIGRFLLCAGNGDVWRS